MWFLRRNKGNDTRWRVGIPSREMILDGLRQWHVAMPSMGNVSEHDGDKISVEK